MAILPLLLNAPLLYGRFDQCPCILVLSNKESKH